MKRIFGAAVLVFAALFLYGRFVDGWARAMVVARPGPGGGERPEEAEAWTLTGRGVSLAAWVFRPRRAAGTSEVDWVLVLHGIGDGKRSMVGLARRFAARGVGAVVLDLRGHGGSSGDALGFGALEVEDLRCALDDLRRRGIATGRLGVYGPSYGGGVAMRFAAADERVDRVFAVAAFATLPDLSYTFLRGRHGDWVELLPRFVFQDVSDAAGRLAGFEGPVLRRPPALKAFRGLALLVHSREDEVVPYAHARALADECTEGVCRVVTLEGYDHLQSLSNSELRRLIDAFFFGVPDHTHGSLVE